MRSAPYFAGELAIGETHLQHGWKRERDVGTWSSQRFEWEVWTQMCPVVSYGYGPHPAPHLQEMIQTEELKGPIWERKRKLLPSILILITRLFDLVFKMNTHFQMWQSEYQYFSKHPSPGQCQAKRSRQGIGARSLICKASIIHVHGNYSDHDRFQCPHLLEKLKVKIESTLNGILNLEFFF